MAEVLTPFAYVTVKDSAKKSSTVSVNVDATDAKAYAAAADTAARAASKVGLLITALEDMMLSAGNPFEYGMNYKLVNDAWIAPLPTDGVYNSNKLNVAYTAIRNGVSVQNTFTIPQRDPSTFTLSSDGVTVQISGLGASAEVLNLLAQINDTMLSVYGTACTVVEITVNDQ